MNTKPKNNAGDEPEENAALAGGAGLFLAQEMAHGDIAPNLVVPPNLILNETAAELSLSDEVAPGEDAEKGKDG